MNRRLLAVAVAAAIATLAAGCAGPARQPADDEVAVVPEADKDAVSGELQRKEDGSPGRDGLAAMPEPKVEEKQQLETITVVGSRIKRTDAVTAQPVFAISEPVAAPPANAIGGTMPSLDQRVAGDFDRESYADHADNPVHLAAESPVSTLSIDVDTGSYSNVRRMLNQGVLPPADAVRAEEMLNYFDYAYAPPASRDVPFSTTVEMAPAPWNADHQLLLVGIKGYEVPRQQIPASNIVFLIDTSGSMDEPNKLPLLRESLKMMASQMREQDRVSIVVYAGSAGLVLPPTPGNRHDEILGALDRLSAGGSTNGGAGIQLAYDMAKLAYIDGGVNRVILATDGDFNVGTVDVEALKTMVGE
ncbi:MAG TPA: von Willebrand factor type A domain-containing protein, partial [Xanthomonadales bacterium]|nr:von Willebrand factor type A domain-containing protein [Xanthomonadales bacterium]